MIRGKALIWIFVGLLTVTFLLLFPNNLSFAAQEGEAIEYGWLSLLPALIAISLCFLTKQPLPSLMIGVFVGASITNNWSPLLGFTRTLEIAVEQMTDSWKAAIMLFTLIIGGLIGLMFLGGGVYAFAEAIKNRVKNSKIGQAIAFALGLIIFFDDYTNTVAVGNSLRSVTDKLRISREKFSYIVDSTAAPVATIALVSSWVGYEVGLIGDALAEAGSSLSAYSVFLNSLPLKFYSIFALVLVVMIILSGRDYGPMLKAEYRARTTGKVFSDTARPLSGGVSLKVKEGIPYKVSNMMVPILSLLGITMFSIWWTGGGPSVPFQEAIQGTDAAKALLWGSMGAVVVTIFWFAIQKLASLGEMMDSFIEGTKMMLIGLLILITAWSIGAITGEMGAGGFVVGLVKDVPPEIIPIVMFIVSCFIAFATGTSWGTMAIGIPIAIPIGLAMGINPAIISSTVLTGAIFGDHCSPISDTTVMSSIFAGSDHMDHVTTQIPYALLAAFVTALGYLILGVTGFNYWFWIPIWAVGFIVMWFALNYLSNNSARKLGLTPSAELWNKLSS